MSLGRRCSTSGMVTSSTCRYLGGRVRVEPTPKVQVYDRTYRSTLIQKAAPSAESTQRGSTSNWLQRPKAKTRDSVLPAWADVESPLSRRKSKHSLHKQLAATRGENADSGNTRRKPAARRRWRQSCGPASAPT